jgi:predicted DCC family thiol-disulfide oxidoreductase YuxK
VVTLRPPSVIVYDGTCLLCSRSIAWVAAHDPEGRFAFTPSGSATATALLGASGLDAATPGTVVLVEDGRVYTRSDAALRVAGRLRGWSSWLSLFRFVPRSLRDAVYLFVARHRHRLNASSACPVPSAEVRARLLQ